MFFQNWLNGLSFRSASKRRSRTRQLQQKIPVVVEICEPRQLQTATSLAMPLTAIFGDLTTPIRPTTPDGVASQVTAEQQVGSSSKKLIFIDPRVSDYQTLLSGRVTGEVVILSPDRNGVEQIASYLRGRSGIEAIHIVSHGQAGAVLLGNSVLDVRTAAGPDAEALNSISQSLTPKADLNLYGCEVAEGEVGQAFLTELAKQTGADVAASTGITGAFTEGGDWILDATTGPIEHAVPFSAAALMSYKETLAIPSIASLDRMTPSQVATILWKHEWNQIIPALNLMSPTRAANVMWARSAAAAVDASSRDGDDDDDAAVAAEATTL